MPASIEVQVTFRFLGSYFYLHCDFFARMEHRTEAVAAAHAGQATARRDGEALTPSRIPVADTRHARGARQLSVDAPPAPERAASAELKLYRSVWLPCVIKELHAMLTVAVVA